MSNENPKLKISSFTMIAIGIGIFSATGCSKSVQDLPPKGINSALGETKFDKTCFYDNAWWSRRKLPTSMPDPLSTKYKLESVVIGIKMDAQSQIVRMLPDLNTNAGEKLDKSMKKLIKEGKLKDAAEQAAKHAGIFTPNTAERSGLPDNENGSVGPLNTDVSAYSQITFVLMNEGWRFYKDGIITEYIDKPRKKYPFIGSPEFSDNRDAMTITYFRDKDKIAKKDCKYGYELHVEIPTHYGTADKLWTPVKIDPIIRNDGSP